MSSPANASLPSSASIPRNLIVFGLPIGYLICLALIPLQIDDLFGLPAHPLLLHLPVVLIPLLTIATVALMVKPAWRKRYGIAWAGFALVALAATVLTVGAGQAWKSEREGDLPNISMESTENSAGDLPQGMPEAGGGGDSDLDHHEELGEQLRIIMFAFSGLIIALVIFDFLRGGGLHRALGLTARVLIALIALLAFVWTFRTGHEGAELAWKSGPGAGGGEIEFPQGMPGSGATGGSGAFPPTSQMPQG
jgi:hypothetical protein